MIPRRFFWLFDVFMLGLAFPRGLHVNAGNAYAHEIRQYSTFAVRIS